MLAGRNFSKGLILGQSCNPIAIAIVGEVSKVDKTFYPVRKKQRVCSRGDAVSCLVPR